MSGGSRVFVEEWPATYGSPYLVTEDEASGSAQLVEDGPDNLLAHPADPEAAESPPTLAFVDGVRRGEAHLYLAVGDRLVRGVAGAHGCGAVLSHPGERPEFERCSVRRLVIWGGGLKEPLPSVRGGWAWDAHAISSEEPDAPLLELQRRMREAEGRLAEELCASGYTTIIDGPLNFVRSRDLPIIGFVKTHHRALLPPEHHVRVTQLREHERTSLFALRADLYSAYLRLAAPRDDAGPWSGIVRIEMPASAGLVGARRAADLAAAVLPRYAGVPHRDARAPQNLQPVGALETHLRHLLGDTGLAVRAVREAVRGLLESVSEVATP